MLNQQKPYVAIQNDALKQHCVRARHLQLIAQTDFNNYINKKIASF